MLAEGRWGAFIQKVKSGNVASATVTPKQNIIQTGAFSPYELPDAVGALKSLNMTGKAIINPEGLTYIVTDPTSDVQLQAFKEYLERKDWWYDDK